MTKINPVLFVEYSNISLSDTIPDKKSPSIWTEITPEIQTENSESDQILKSSIKYKEHKINTGSVRGSYSFEKKGDKYILVPHFEINMLENKTAQIFYKDSNVINPDDDGNYRFRGISAKRPERLNDKIYMAALKIVTNVEIYKDLIKRENRGEKLSPIEIEFIKNTPKLLDKYGLKFDENGEVADK